MPIRVHFGLEAIFGFLLTLTRVGSALALFPAPGLREMPQTARAGLVIATTLCLFPIWPSVHFDQLSSGQFLMAVLGEATSGLILGLAILLLHESFQVAAQMISMQAGFSFASTVDPSSQADSNVLLVLTQFATGLLFFALGIHLHLLRFFAYSYSVFATGRTPGPDVSVGTVISLGGTMLITGLRTGLPVVTLLLLIEIALGVLGRLQAQMQLISLAFPVKTALSFLFLAIFMTRWPAIYERTAREVFDVLSKIATAQ
jgi:flagellar biosynthesis protein FliR